jgi:hypothetical protein
MPSYTVMLSLNWSVTRYFHINFLNINKQALVGLVLIGSLPSIADVENFSFTCSFTGRDLVKPHYCSPQA